MRTALTTTERATKRAADEDIAKGRKMMGGGLELLCRAYRVYHEKELWREEASSFDDWCDRCAEESRTVVYDMIRADVEGLSAIADNLGQARALFGLPLTEAKTVVRLVEAAGKKTAAGITSMRQAFAGKKPKERLEILQQTRQERRAEAAERERRAALAGGRASLEESAKHARKAMERLAGHLTKKVEADVAEALRAIAAAVGRIRKMEAAA